MIGSASSRPVRARGLKRYTHNGVDRVTHVAPRAGAWLETPSTVKKSTSTCVAPRAGAWLETVVRQKCCPDVRSRPVRARGLKPSISV